MTRRAAWPAVFLMGVLMCVCPDWAPAEDVKPVFQYSANGTRNTRPFTVQDRWELQWDAKGGKLAIFLFTADGERQGVLPIVTQEKSGSGASYYPKGGSYYLKVVTEGDWNITVVQVP